MAWPAAGFALPCCGLATSALERLGLLSSSERDRLMGADVLLFLAAALFAPCPGPAPCLDPGFVSRDHPGTGGLGIVGEMAILLAGWGLWLG